MRPYYNDPYTVNFNATVIDTSKRDGEFIVSLDESYFYPTSGGQEHDTGFIEDSEVLDVFEEDGRVLHVVSGEVPAGKVNCRINWARRFNNMQQHTGQHILSAAFENLFGIETVSSRLGEYAGTIDLSRQPTDSEIDRVINETNAVIRDNRPVNVHYAERGSIGSFNLRKPPKVEGTVRIIEVRDFDMSPCGGTHCTHTSEIGVVLTGNVERVKSAITRIEFYCGDRALRRYYEVQKSARDTSRILFSAIEDIPSAAEKLRILVQEKENRLKFLTERVLEDMCEKLVARVKSGPAGVNFIDLTSELQTTEELRFVASCVSHKTSTSFAFERVDGNICYMNLNLYFEETRATAIMNELRAKCGVKGGGRNGFYSLAFEKSRIDDVAALIEKGMKGE